MEVKKYVVITVLVLLTLALITAGVFGYMWGKSSAEVKTLKDEKKRYELITYEQDSVITVEKEAKTVLLNSIKFLVENAVEENDGTGHARVIVIHDKEVMNEKVKRVPNLPADSIVKLFNREADSYKP